MTISLEREAPDSPDGAALVLELEDHLAARYPAESRHGFSVERLAADGVHFFVLREDGAAVGCGGVLLVDGEYGEIKRMFVRPEYRGRGFGRVILAHLVAHAQGLGFGIVRLETGADQVEAISLYASAGFRRCAPFGPYREDPLSPCYELRLT